MHGGDGLTFCMLMCADQRQKWLSYCYGLSIFLILVPLWQWNWSYLGFLGIFWRMPWSKCRRGRGGSHQEKWQAFYLSQWYIAIRYNISLVFNLKNSHALHNETKWYLYTVFLPVQPDRSNGTRLCSTWPGKEVNEIRWRQKHGCAITISYQRYRLGWRTDTAIPMKLAVYRPQNFSPAYLI